jgi:hypothetical protein
MANGKILMSQRKGVKNENINIYRFKVVGVSRVGLSHSKVLTLHYVGKTF